MNKGSMANIGIEALFELACMGCIKELDEYYKSGGKKNVRYKRFNEEHSLIMGAYRNNNFDTVHYLLSIGETLTEKEQEEVNLLMKKLQIIKLLATN